MTLLDVLVAALVQGLGEALPLGASGLLSAFPILSGPPEGRAFLAVAAHCGILLALMAYFWRDMVDMAVGLWKLAKGKPDRGTRLFLHLLAGTAPAALAGWFLLDRIASWAGPVLAGALLVAGGLLLWLSDKLGVTVRRIEHMGFGSAVGLGVLQILALVPGVSRTGLTITAARLLGWERQSAARFSLLLAVPLIAGHGGRTLWDLSRQADLIWTGDLFLAAVVAGLVTLLAVSAMMAWVNRRSFAPFAVARIVLGAAALVLALWSGR